MVGLGVDVELGALVKLAIVVLDNIDITSFVFDDIFFVESDSLVVWWNQSDSNFLVDGEHDKMC